MRYVCPKEDALETGQVSLLEAVGSEARARRIEGEGIRLEPALALLRKKTKEEETEKTSKLCQKIGSGRRRSAAKTLRHWFVI